MGDITSSYSGGTPQANNPDYYNGSIPFIRSAEINADKTELYLTEKGLAESSAALVDAGCILYALYGATSGEVGISRINGAINQAILAIYPYAGFDSGFLVSWLRREKDAIVVTYLQGGQGNLSGAIVKDLEVPVPSLPEQKAIGDCLSSLDNLITLHQRKCEYRSLCGYLSWEQRKLGELGYAQSGVGFPDVEQGGNEGVPFFKVSDMNLEGNELVLVHSNNYVTDEQITRRSWRPIADVPAMLFAKVGAAVMLNRKRLVTMPFLLDNNTMAYSFSYDLWDMDFGRALFETLDLPSLVQVGALPSYNASDVESMPVTIPSSIEEEREIGAFFNKLDSLITLHQ